MPATEIAEQAPAVDKPQHKLSELTTYALKGYKRQLESATTFFDRKTPVPAARGDLQATLDAVIAEQDDRARVVSRARA